MKIRMSSVDVAGEVACLKQRLLGLRVANVYDINGKVCFCPSICFELGLNQLIQKVVDSWH